MYPYLRLARTLIKTKWQKPLHFSEITKIPMRVCLVDIDPFMELNNGRHLTMMDFGRFAMAIRMGLLRVVKEKGWGLTVAGSSVRYRKRLTLFQRYYLHTQIVASDDKWIYFHQQMVRKGVIHSAALVRTGVTSKNGLVKVEEVIKAMGFENTKVEMPDWVKAWSVADNQRPWEVINGFGD